MLRRNLNDWEMDSVVGLYERLYSFNLNPEVVDVHLWNWDEKGSFLVRFCYFSLTVDMGFYGGGGRSFEAFEVIWKLRMPSKLPLSYGWCFRGRVLTLVNIIARGILWPNQCCMCYASAKSVDHLFMHCPVASSV